MQNHRAVRHASSFTDKRDLQAALQRRDQGSLLLVMTETPPVYERVLAQAKPVCDVCGAMLSARRERGAWEVENELCLTLSGSYASFVDTAISDHDRYSYLLCEACALRLCRSFGLRAPVREHHTSTVCECPDRPARDARGFPTRCRCTNCAT